MSVRLKTKSNSKKQRDHQLEDTVSYLDEQRKIPEAEREKYEQFTLDLAEEDRELTALYESNKEWTARILQLRRVHKVQPRKAQLKAMYEKMVADGTILTRNMGLENYLTMKQSRSLSGVLVISVLMSPYPRYTDRRTGRTKQQRFTCAHNCYYCPNEPGMPRSYLSTEAAVARATRVDFDAIDQFYARANTLKKMGHDVDKVELLILGGTFCQFPPEYSEQFIRDLYWAANTFYDGHSRFEDKRARQSLAEEIKIHEMAAKCRIIGLTLETRPDTIRDFNTILKFRKYGATRLQVGVQHTDDDVLTKINRGCEHKHTVRAVRLLKNAGYKIDIHLMPNLPGSTPEKDTKMFERMLSDELVQCDQWKVYPCQTVDFSLIKKWYDEGEYRPYPLEQLMEVVIKMKSAIHPWIRLNRIFRALPVEHITSGITMSNFRQHMYAKMEEKGLKCRCIRCREIGTHIRRRDLLKTQKSRTSDHGATDYDEALSRKLAQKPVLRKRRYQSSGGHEFFISMESQDESVLMGFVRLRLPVQWIKPSDRERFNLSDDSPFLGDFSLPPNGRYGDLAEYEQLHATFPELYRAALVREAHVYGAKQKKKDSKGGGFGDKTKVGSKLKGESSEKNAVREKQQLTAQSKGYGSKLMAEAERIAKGKGYRRVAVIAGVGTKLYYRLQLGYKVAGTYMVKDFAETRIGRTGKGDVNTSMVVNLVMAVVLSLAVLLALNFTALWSVSAISVLLFAVIYMLFLDYLHLVRIDYDENVNNQLLGMSRMSLFAMNLCVVLKLCSAFAPNMGGALDFLIYADSPDTVDATQDGSGLGGNDNDDGSLNGDLCGAMWSGTLACYVAGFYVLKMMMVKRLWLLIQDPLFGNDRGMKKMPMHYVFLLLSQILAFAACEFLVMNLSDAWATAGAVEGYDAESGFACHQSVYPMAIWTAIIAIAFDFIIYADFCRRWYAFVLVLMEESAMIVQWQICVVCLCMASCVLDAVTHLSLLRADDFDAMQGTAAFVLDCCVIATACCLSFSGSMSWALQLLKLEGKAVQLGLESMRYRLHIL